MAQGGNTQLLEVCIGQAGQDLLVNVVVDKGLRVLGQRQCAQPVANVESRGLRVCLHHMPFEVGARLVRWLRFMNCGCARRMGPAAPPLEHLGQRMKNGLARLVGVALVRQHHQAGRAAIAADSAIKTL